MYPDVRVHNFVHSLGNNMDNIQATRLNLINNLRTLASYDETYAAMLALEIDAYNACYDAAIE